MYKIDSYFIDYYHQYYLEGEMCTGGANPIKKCKTYEKKLINEKIDRYILSKNN